MQTMLLLGFFVGKRPCWDTINYSLNRAWKPKDELEIQRQGEFYIFKFKSFEESQNILEAGPWFVHGQLLVLKRWSKNQSMQKDELNSIPIWVKLPNRFAWTTKLPPEKDLNLQGLWLKLMLTVSFQTLSLLHPKMLCSIRRWNTTGSLSDASTVIHSLIQLANALLVTNCTMSKLKPRPSIIDQQSREGIRSLKAGLELILSIRL